MKPEIQKRLSDALRSGEYPQTTGQLNRVEAREAVPAGYCCLGVLSEEAVKENVIVKRDNGISSEFGTEDEFENFTPGLSFPPESVATWAGLVWDDNTSPPTIMFDVTGHPDLKMDDIMDIHNRGGKLILGAHELNDNHNFTFEMIADLIDSGKIVTDIPPMDKDEDDES